MTKTTSKASPKTEAEKPAETRAVALSPIDRIAAMAKEAKATEAIGGQFISTQNGQFTVGGVSTKSLDVVVLDWVLENALFTRPYDRDNPETPMCFAFARARPGAEAAMEPHAEAKNPQCEKCAGCGANQFTSAQTGGG